MKPKLILLAMLLAGFLTSPLRAGFEEGWDAYQRGDFTMAMAEWKQLAQDGDARAQFNLGVLFDQGRGVMRNHVTAVHWWRKSADQGFASAQHNLANSLIAVEAGVRQAVAVAQGVGEIGG